MSQVQRQVVSRVGVPRCGAMHASAGVHVLSHAGAAGTRVLVPPRWASRVALPPAATVALTPSRGRSSIASAVIHA